MSLKRVRSLPNVCQQKKKKKKEEKRNIFLEGCSCWPRVRKCPPDHRKYHQHWYPPQYLDCHSSNRKAELLLAISSWSLLRMLLNFISMFVILLYPRNCKIWLQFGLGASWMLCQARIVSKSSVKWLDCAIVLFDCWAAFKTYWPADDLNLAAIIETLGPDSVPWLCSKGTPLAYAAKTERKCSR